MPAPMPTKHHIPIDQLAEKIRRIELQGRFSSSDQQHRITATGWVETDQLLQQAGGLPGLVHHGVHEWYGMACPPPETSTLETSKVKSNKHWAPALAVLVHLARCALRASDHRLWVIWIGKRCWPSIWSMSSTKPANPDAESPNAQHLSHTDKLLLDRSIFVDPPDRDARLWAGDLALRCTAAAAVIIDGRGFDISATRRLQLATEAGHALALLARPAHERAVLSAATTRWLVRYAPCPNQIPNQTQHMSVELLRCKSTGTIMGGTHKGGTEARKRRWTLQWDRQKGVVTVSADVADRPGQTSGAPRTPNRHIDRTKQGLISRALPGGLPGDLPGAGAA